MSTESTQPRPGPPTAPPTQALIEPRAPEPGSAPRPKRAFPVWRVAAVVLVLAALIGTWRLSIPRATAHTEPAMAPQLQTVAAARVVRRDLYTTVSIPAEFRPYLQVELHAKVSGYLESIDVDIGDRVKAGQLLARLEVPELKDELDRAQATEKRAEADYKDAHLVYSRLLLVEKAHPNLVAQQELDAAEAKDATTDAVIQAAKADVEKYRTMLSYTRITAPFDGVVTHRYADPGSLIQAGTASDTQSMPLVRLSDNYRLRLDFPVSVTYVKDIKIGEEVEVRVDSLGGKVFKGKISRCAERIDSDTRTMTTEIEVPNPELELVPGMYATLSLNVERRARTLVIPTEAVTADKKSSVYVIGPNQEIQERPVKLGLETPSRYEVLAGLKEGELVMLGNRSQVSPGQKVATKLFETLAQQ